MNSMRDRSGAGMATDGVSAPNFVVIQALRSWFELFSFSAC